MNAVAKTSRSVEDYVSAVLDGPRMSEIALELPGHIKAALFQRNLFHAIAANPDLMEFSPGLIFREVAKAASLGLLLDPQLGEAYLVVAYNYKSRSKEPQLRIGYRGLIKLVRQSGDVKIVYAHEVKANDFIECELGLEKRLVHKPILFGDRGETVGYYAVAKLANGEHDFEPMSINEVDTIRDRSDGWKAFQEGKIKSTPWSSDPDEMGKKTVLRRLMKRTSQSPELAEAINIEDAGEFQGGARRLAIAPPVPTPRRTPPNPNVARAEGPALITAEQASELARALTDLGKGAWTEFSKTWEVSRLGELSAGKFEAAITQLREQLEAKEQKTPPNPSEVQTAVTEPPKAATSAFDWDGYRTALNAAMTQKEADDVFVEWIDTRNPALSVDDEDQVQALLRERCDKLPYGERDA